MKSVSGSRSRFGRKSSGSACGLRDCASPSETSPWPTRSAPDRSLMSWVFPARPPGNTAAANDPSGRPGVGPRRLGEHAVALFGLRAADGDQLQSLGPGLEGTHDPRRDPDDVPRADVAHLVVEPDAAGARHDDVGLLLLAVAVAARVAQVRRVPPEAHPEVA